MGPVLIFDKSTLESLNPDEAMWLDNFFLTNITPLFFVETLADLEKEVQCGRTPEQVVGNLAYKTPDMSSKPSTHHTTLLQGELLGLGQVDMKYGRPIITGGQAMELGGKTGIVFKQSPEEEAFQRWQRGEFLEIERSTARLWRRALSNSDLETRYQLFKHLYTRINKPKSLSETKILVDNAIDNSNQEDSLRNGLMLIGVSDVGSEKILNRWRSVSSPPIQQFAPYFRHVYGVEFLFYLALSADLIGRGRPSHKIDLAYLYYLPFCMVFTSNDKLHINLAPLFLRENQTFIRGDDLKVDLAKLDQYYSSLPEEVKACGVFSFAFYPPTEGSFLVSQLWDKHMSSEWRQRAAEPRKPPTKEESASILEEMKKFKKNAVPIDRSQMVNSDDASHMIIQRKVYSRKGKWRRFPPEVENSKKRIFD